MLPSLAPSSIRSLLHVFSCYVVVVLFNLGNAEPLKCESEVRIPCERGRPQSELQLGIKSESSCESFGNHLGPTKNKVKQREDARKSENCIGKPEK